MSSLSYTTGNPSNLVAGNTASMTDISGPFTDIRTFLNGANLDDTNLATNNKVVTIAGAYRTLGMANFTGSNSASSGINLPSQGGTGLNMVANGGEISADSGLQASAVVPIAAASMTVGSLTTKLRWRSLILTNATAPAVTFTVGLYSFASSGGGAGALTPTVGTVVGTTLAITTPAGSAATVTNSSDFTVVADGVYVIGVSLSGTPAANSTFNLLVYLDGRNV